MQVGLISKHNHKFRLLAIGSLRYYPRSHLVRNIEQVAPDTLPSGARRTNRP